MTDQFNTSPNNDGFGQMPYGQPSGAGQSNGYQNPQNPYQTSAGNYQAPAGDYQLEFNVPTINGMPVRLVNKVLYILAAIFLGGFGVHRFLRGQVGLGIVMIFFGWLTLGIWWFVDVIIGLVKLSAYPNTDNFVFDWSGNWIA